MNVKALIDNPVRRLMLSAILVALFSLLVQAFLGGCKKGGPLPPPQVSEKGVPQRAVFDLLADTVGRGSSSISIRMLRKDYAILEPGWVAGKFSSDFWSFLRAKGYASSDGAGGLKQYSLDFNNCLDFAEDARYYMREIERSSKAGFRVAWGRAIYYPDTGGRHAINVFLSSRGQGKAPEVLFWEPQRQEVVALSAMELRDCEIEM